MMNRRALLLSALAAGSGVAAAPAAAERVVRLPKKFFPQEVDINPELPAGRIYAVTEKHFLYWTLGDGRAIRYGMAVGAEGRAFKGTAIVGRKVEWPSWRPTQNMIRLEPEVYGPYREGLPGGDPNNPLGARALYLYQNGRDSLFRIHGTPQPWTIGRSFSSGCLRLINEHIEDLYARVPNGTLVTVV